MRIVISQQGYERIFFVTNAEPTTTLQEVLEGAHIDLRHFEHVWVDGREVDRSLGIREVGLCEGAVVSDTPGTTGDADRRVSEHWQLVIVGGATCARVYDLPASGLARIGRSDEVEISLESASVSWSHAVIDVTEDGVHVVDHDSANGTYLNGKKIGGDPTHPALMQPGDVLSVGGVCLMLSDPRQRAAQRAYGVVGKVQTAGAGGRIAFNRPPRAALPPHAGQVSVPVRKEPDSPARFSWIAVIAPLLMAGLLVFVLGSTRYALSLIHI